MGPDGAYNGADNGAVRAAPPNRAAPPTEPRRSAEPRRPTKPRRLTEPHCPACTATAATASTAAMASPTVLTFDAEGRAVDVDVWVDDLQLFLQCDSRDGVSLFDHTSSVSTALAATADSTVRSQWTTRDVVARLAVHSHLPPAKRAHFGQCKTAKSLYDAVVARYSSPATAALNRLMLPYLFPDLAAFATVADLITHLRTSDACYRAALPTEFCAKNPPPMYITLYYLVTRLPDSLVSARDHFLSLCPTELTVDLLEEHLAAAEKMGGAATPRARGARVVGGMAGAAAEAVEEAEEVAVEVGVVPGVGASVAAVEVVEAAAAVVVVEAAVKVVEAAAAVVEAAAAVAEVAVAVVLQLREWYAGRGRPGRAGPFTYVLRTGSHRGETCRLRHIAQRCFGRLTDAWRAHFPYAVELPRWGDLLRQNVAMFDLDLDAILAAMNALTDSAEGDCYLSVPPDPGIEAAALGASASVAPGIGEPAAPGAGESAHSGTAPTEALHSFTLDSGASRSFVRDSTTLTPLSRPVALSLADPSGCPVLAHSSTVLTCPAAPSGLLSGLHLPSFSTNLVSGADLQDEWVDQFNLGGQCVTHCTCSRTGRHLATFTCRPGSSLYTLTTASPLVSASGQVAASSQVFAAASRSSPTSAPCSCRPLSHKTLLWHHHLGHPSLPRLRGMASRALRAAPHSSTFPPTEAPLQTLHMDVKGEVPEVLIDWIRGACHQRSERFGSDLPILRLHSDRGGGFSSDLLRAFCRAEGIRQTFTLPASPQQNGIAERRIGMVMDVVRTSMIHAAAPHFLWPFVVQYAVHQINLQPRVSLSKTTPTLRWTGKVGDASAFRVWGSRAFVRDTSADKLSSRAFCHPTSRRVLSSQDVTFDKSVSYYHLFPYRTASLPPPTLFLAPGSPPVDPIPPQGPAPSGVSQVDPAKPVEVAVDSGAAGGAKAAGAGIGGAEPGGVEPERAESGGAEPVGVGTGGAEPGDAEPERAEPGGTASWGAEPARAESGGSPGVPLRREPLSPQRLREWYCCEKNKE
ncbi:unnamed protein product [Closterium sp. NIES-53]